MGFEAMKPIIRRSVIASLAALAVTFGLLLPTAASAQSPDTKVDTFTQDQEGRVDRDQHKERLETHLRL